jgi:hypothetical protein
MKWGKRLFLINNQCSQAPAGLLIVAKLSDCRCGEQCACVRMESVLFQH